MPKTVAKPLLQTIFSGYIGQGEKVEQFEKALSGYIGNSNLLTTNSATSALHLALRVANVGPGDEVISTPLTCAATNWPILAAGADIVWADIDPKTANISPQSIKEKITSKTKAIMIVDWGGQPADLDMIRKIAFKKIGGKKVKIPVIEDAAHALGAVYKTKRIGNWSDFTVFSFQAIKHITTIDGGMLVFKNKNDYKRGKLLRWYGIDRDAPNRDSRIEQDVFEWGYKFHMNDVSATIGLEQLKYLDGILKKHRDNAAYFLKNLKNIKGVTLIQPQPDSVSSYWLFTMQVKFRNRFKSAMQKQGIMTSQVHRRNDTHPVVKKFKTKLPNLDIFEKEMICIPVGWWLTQKNKDYIVRSIKKGW